MFGFAQDALKWAGKYVLKLRHHFQLRSVTMVTLGANQTFPETYRLRKPSERTAPTPESEASYFRMSCF